MPPRLSEFDREQLFTLTSADVAAIREQFSSGHRLPAALMLMFMRVAGRPLDGFDVLPRNLLRHTAQVLAVSPPSIASLRSIYKRRQTHTRHRLWAKTYLGLRELEVDDEAALTTAPLAQAADASHADGLVRSARAAAVTNGAPQAVLPAAVGSALRRVLRWMLNHPGDLGSLLPKSPRRKTLFRGRQ